MKQETFRAVLASSLFITLMLASLAGIAWSVYKGDELFALSFASYILQIVWMLVLTFKTPASASQGDQS
ncbi:MAG: hypothetical protein ACFHVJ_10920 [Aestuariibacter sp.]